MAYVKVYDYKKQISFDDGVTWVDVTPSEYAPSGTPVGYYDELEACESSRKFILGLNDSSTVSAECDASSAITRDETNNYISNITSIKIGDCTTSINTAAFAGSNNLTNLTIGDNVTTIGSYVFQSCTNLTNLLIPSNVNNIGNGAFSYCNNLSRIIIEAVTPPILGSDDDTFNNTNNCPIYVPCESVDVYKMAWPIYADRIKCLRKFTLTLSDLNVITASCDSTSSITRSEISAYTPSLVDVEIGDCVTSINTAAFGNISGLTNVVISNSVQEIGKNAFYYNSKLKNISIGSGVTFIDDGAFSYGLSTDLDFRIYATTPPTLGSNVFSNSGRFSIHVPCESVDAYKSAWSGLSADRIVCMSSNKAILEFQDGSELTMECDSSSWSSSAITSGQVATQFSGTVVSVDIGDCTNIISGYAFYDCSKLSSVTISDSVTTIGYAAFAGCSSLKTITIPSSVTSIGQAAFSYCTGLTGVTINSTTPPTLESNVFNNTNNCPIFVPCESVDTYKSRWISYADRIQCMRKYELTLNNSNIVTASCDNTSSITQIEISTYSYSTKSAIIGYCVTNIDMFAFNGFNSLTSVTISNTVTSLGLYAFQNCTNLTNVTIPNSITSINAGTFFNCNGLTSIAIPNSVTNISQSAFAYCSSLTGITVPDSVTSIGDSTFSGCTNLRSVNLPYRITSINSNTFKGCTNLRNISIPYNVTSIGDQAFSGCTALPNVTIPYRVTSIGSNAFANCSGLTSIICEATTPPTLGSDVFNNTNNCPIFVPCESVDAYKSAWTNYTNRIECMRKYTFTMSGSSWGSVVTAVCDSTSAVTSGDVYSYRNKMVSAEIGNCVTSIGDRTFSGCTALSSVTMSDSVTSIGSSAFYNCSKLTGITIPSGLTTINPGAFSRCGSITSISIPNSVTSIGDAAFYDCSGLTSISIPNNVVTIGKNAFENCYRLTNCTIGVGVTSIGNYAFRNCSGLTSVNIPSGVTSIGNYTFTNCYSLTNIDIPSGITGIGEYAFYNCSGLTSMDIPSGVTTINTYTFAECSGLTSVNIPSGVTNIYDFAFAGCSSLSSVTIPSGITVLWYGVFVDCSSLSSITILATEPPMLYSYPDYYSNDVYPLDNTNNCPIYVPSGSVEAYKIGIWRRYADRILAIQ